MDTDGSGGGFHRDETISAVDEDQFYGDDEDYDDLYNDVNVGEGFHHSLAGEAAPPPPVQPPPAAAAPTTVSAPPQEQKVQIPGVATGEAKIERPNQAISAPVVAQTPQVHGNPHDGFQRQGPMGGGHNGGINGVGGGDNLAGTKSKFRCYFSRLS